MHAEHTTAPLADCPNCGVSLRAQDPPARYCPHCGQETVLHPPSVAEFAHEFVGHYVALEGPLWRSLRLLVLHPGRLTVEYLRGRRRLYVLPLRLYLSASFVFFLALKLMASAALPATHGPDEQAGAARAVAGAASAAAAGEHERTIVIMPGRLPQETSPAKAEEIKRATRRRAEECARGSAASAASGAACGWFERNATGAGSRWAADPVGTQAEFVAHAIGVAPYVVFLMLPVYAGIVALAYRRRRMGFGEHVVFGMHLHALWFLAGTLALPLPDAASGVVPLLAAGHAVLAQRRVYGGGWAWTFARSAAIALLYTLCLLFVTLAVAFWLFIR